MPVSRIDVVRVGFLLMEVGFIGDIEDSIKENCPELVSSLAVSLLLADAHLDVPLLEGGDVPSQLPLHLVEAFLFPPLRGLSVDLPPLVIASLSQLAIVHDHLLALFSAPLLIDKLFLLLGLPLEALQDLVLPLLLLHVLVSLHLIDDHLSSSSLSFLAVGFADNLLVLGP